MINLQGTVSYSATLFAGLFAILSGPTLFADSCIIGLLVSFPHRNTISKVSDKPTSDKKCSEGALPPAACGCPHKAKQRAAPCRLHLHLQGALSCLAELPSGKVDGGTAKKDPD